MAATDDCLGVYELLENILLHLPPTDLTRVTRLSRTWNNSSKPPRLYATTASRSRLLKHCLLATKSFYAGSAYPNTPQKLSCASI